MVEILELVNSLLVVVAEVDGVWTQVTSGNGTALAKLDAVPTTIGLKPCTILPIGSTLLAPQTSSAVTIGFLSSISGEFTSLMQAQEAEIVLASLFAEASVDEDNYLKEDSYVVEAERTILTQYKKRT